LDIFGDLQDMASPGLDGALAERFMTGAIEPDDAPPGFDLVASLIHAAQEPATSDELAARADTVIAFAAHVRARSIASARTKGIYGVSKFSAKVLASATLTVFLGCGIAAATDSLPPSAQATLSRVLSHLGISVPNRKTTVQGIGVSPPAAPGSGTATSTGLSTGSLGSAATTGLCRAWKAHGLSHRATARRTLLASAGGAGNLAAYCRGVLAIPVTVSATGHDGNLSLGRLEGGQGATRTSTTDGQKGVSHRADSLPTAQGVRRSGAGARGTSVVTTATAPTAPLQRHQPKAPGTSRFAVGSPRRPPVTVGPPVRRGTRQATKATARAGGNGPSTKAGQGGPPAARPPTPVSAAPVSPVTAIPISPVTAAPISPVTAAPVSPVTAAPISPVTAVPISPVTPANGGPARHHGQRGHHAQRGHSRNRKGCPGTAGSGPAVRTPPRCHPVTPTAPSGGSSSTGSRRHGAPGRRHVLSGVSHPTR